MEGICILTVVWVLLVTGLYFAESSSNDAFKSFAGTLGNGAMIAFADSSYVRLLTPLGKTIGVLLVFYRNIFYVAIGVLLAPAAKNVEEEIDRWSAKHFSKKPKLVEPPLRESG